jgi:hypothetical protein
MVHVQHCQKKDAQPRRSPRQRRSVVAVPIWCLSLPGPEAGPGLQHRSKQSPCLPIVVALCHMAGSGKPVPVLHGDATADQSSQGLARLAGLGSFEMVRTNWIAPKSKFEMLQHQG